MPHDFSLLNYIKYSLYLDKHHLYDMHVLGGGGGRFF